MTFVLLIAASLLTLCVGMYCGFRARRNSSRFWSMLLIGLVFTTPLSIAGYTWYDEIFVGGFLLAGLPAVNGIPRTSANAIFMLFCAYLFVQAMRGIAFFSDFGVGEAAQKLRWPVFVVLIFLLFVKSTKLPDVLDQRLPYRLTVAGLVFNCLYIAFGVVAILTTGSIDFTQYAMISDVYRAGTSPLLAVFGSTQYVVCVYFVIVPAALISVRTGFARQRVLGWLTLAIALASQMLYNSRSGMLLLVAFIGLFLLSNLRSRRVLKGLVAFVPLVLAALLFQLLFNETPLTAILEDIENTLRLGDPSRYDPDLQDIDRIVWNFSAILALSENPINAFFGWGLRTSGHIVAPYVYDLFLQARGSAVFTDDVATPGFAALAVDTGAVGLLLLFMLWAATVYRLFKCGVGINVAFLFAPTAFVLQLFVANIFDVILLYLALMPSGFYGALFASAGYPIVDGNTAPRARRRASLAFGGGPIV